MPGDRVEVTLFSGIMDIPRRTIRKNTPATKHVAATDLGSVEENRAENIPAAAATTKTAIRPDISVSAPGSEVP